MYCAQYVTEIIGLLEDYNTKNQKLEHTFFDPVYNSNYKILYEGANSNRFSNCSIKTYDEDKSRWVNICTYVRSAQIRKFKCYGTLGYNHITAQFIQPITQKKVISYLVDDDDSWVDISPIYDDHENIESFLFQQSVLSELEYDTACKTYLINCISTKLRFGEASIYESLYGKSEEELRVIIHILKDALNA